uniref:Uncharacterized protein n=1 Tax=Candidatus Kentrum sp. SD TaxID=2126332 RepID=A0A450Z5U8_9GAMM|nr:MAG: conserved hypothetical protein [Candidatus Kentron sp. SD]VFK49175.1 MAG: conserved hypothetical protein [Candidatus Kentron sp. SD]VFK78550.1 MAG: conserved hypothetical protein [Candidatus Kentron sp. SD]
MKTMRRLLHCAMGCFLVLPIARANTDPQPVHDFSANAAITTDYLFRGVSQTNEKPAIQAGFDYTHIPSGTYLGTWISSIDFNTDGAAGDAFIETDFYGGIAGEFANGVSWDVGGIYYYYPNQKENSGGDFDCLEVYGGLGYTFSDIGLQPTVGVKLSYSNDYFGEDGNSLYSEGSLNLSLPQDFGLGLHLGFSDVQGDKTTPAGYDYLHGRMALSKEIAGFDFALSYHRAIDDDDCPANEDLCRAVIFSASHGF